MKLPWDWLAAEGMREKSKTRPSGSENRGLVGLSEKDIQRRRRFGKMLSPVWATRQQCHGGSSILESGA